MITDKNLLHAFLVARIKEIAYHFIQRITVKIISIILLLMAAADFVLPDG